MCNQYLKLIRYFTFFFTQSFFFMFYTVAHLNLVAKYLSGMLDVNLSFIKFSWKNKFT